MKLNSLGAKGTILPVSGLLWVVIHDYDGIVIPQTFIFYLSDSENIAYLWFPLSYCSARCYVSIIGT